MLILLILYAMHVNMLLLLFNTQHIAYPITMSTAGAYNWKM